MKDLVLSEITLVLRDTPNTKVDVCSRITPVSPASIEQTRGTPTSVVKVTTREKILVDMLPMGT